MTYYISHYIYKDFDELQASDTDKVCNNWKRMSEDYMTFENLTEPEFDFPHISEVVRLVSD